MANLLITFTNEYGRFELILGDKPKVRVTPADKTRLPQSFDLDSVGIPSQTVLLLQAHLGLDNKGQIPARAEGNLRREVPNPTQQAPGGASLMMALLGGCGDPSCPNCGGQPPSGPFGNLQSFSVRP